MRFFLKLFGSRALPRTTTLACGFLNIVVATIVVANGSLSEGAMGANRWYLLLGLSDWISTLLLITVAA